LEKIADIDKNILDEIRIGLFKIKTKTIRELFVQKRNT